MGILRKLEYDTLIEIIEHFEKKYPVLILINFDIDWYKYHILIECIREDCVRRHYTERLTTIDISLEDSPKKLLIFSIKNLKNSFLLRLLCPPPNLKRMRRLCPMLALIVGRRLVVLISVIFVVRSSTFEIRIDFFYRL